MNDRRTSPLAAALLAWFQSHRRALPWRERRTPYATWISEIMLQQTQVKTVIPYFLRWMERFPDAQAVARASRDEILKHWEGLGYYSRAANIQKTARILADRFQGSLPRDHKALLDLPGIGPYTAGAVMSMAFNEPFAVVDGNVERVFARLFNIERPVKEREARRFIHGTAQGLLPPGKAGSFNEALMELGALVCTPKNPSCSSCPVALHCESLRQGVVEQRPVTTPRKPTTALQVAAGVLVRDGRIFVQKRPPDGLMPNLWEFPGGKLENGESPEEALVREFREELELSIQCLDPIMVVRHSYTVFRVTLHAFFCRLFPPDQTPVLRAAVDLRWATPRELDRLAFPAANAKLIRKMQKEGWLDPS